MSNSTALIFRKIFSELPPLFPPEKTKRARVVLAYLDSPSGGVNSINIENELMEFGYHFWPWKKAYEEFLSATEKQAGENFLLPMLSSDLREKYAEFKLYGGTFEDLITGGPAVFFTEAERMELTPALIDTRRKLRKYSKRAVQGLERQKYEKKVNEYEAALEEIKSGLEKLRFLAEQEAEHETVKNEILSVIEKFEQGLCCLGPDVRCEDVKQSVEFFLGRKQDLNRMRGIHLPAKMNFFD
ncbi:MAG: hypothetical protein PHY40_01250 [Patescibacteria group bacterium]|nr:hypothetical protein [Patescibacteria group bacterium]